jgi:hypothetical protein
MKTSWLVITVTWCSPRTNGTRHALTISSRAQAASVLSAAEHAAEIYIVPAQGIKCSREPPVHKSVQFLLCRIPLGSDVVHLYEQRQGNYIIILLCIAFGFEKDMWITDCDH